MLDAVIDKPDPALPSGASPPHSPGATGGSLLAGRYLDLLVQDANRRRRPNGRAGRRTDNSGFGEAEIDDWEVELPADEEPAEPARPADVTLSVDEAAAAILLAVRIEEDPELRRVLRGTAPIFAVQAPDSRSRPFLERVLKVCVLGPETKVLTGRQVDALTLVPRALAGRHAVVLTCDVERRDRETLEQRSLGALALGLPVFAVSADVGRNVPVHLRTVADRVLFPGGWKPGLLALLIQFVTGDAVAVADEPWIAGLTLDDLRMSMSRQRGGEESLRRVRTLATRRRMQAEEVPELASLSGYGEARRRGLELIQDLHDLREGRIGWSDVGRGLVLAGPPGTGKSFFARCFAKSAGLPLVVASLAQWQASGDGHLGDCLKAMRLSFSEARACAPSVLFIDELDSLGDRSTFDRRHRDYSTQVVNCLLEELDGAGDRAGVVVLAATNNPDRVDPAIVRSGRLDHVVKIGLPDVDGLAGILRTQLGEDLPFADLRPVAAAGCGGTGADAASWVRQARGVARRAGRGIEVGDLLAAMREGGEPLPAELRERVALHEAAHACAAAALALGSVHGISIHDGGGITVVEYPRWMPTRREAVDLVVHALAGRAAETVFLGAASAGAGGDATSDLARATRLAFSMEASWGLGDAGPVWMGDGDHLSALMRVSAFVEPVRRVLLHGEAEAARLVAANADAIHRCADRLLEASHLDAEMVKEALGPIPRFVVAPVPPRTHPLAGDGSAARA
ncbi:AAA family ATPase [Antarcticirhabdus aurantiaca]|uniref:AAA family ATPase n=1 Tax=Antarcticirhabdus aurantiaca TaxID=2606717 RepID=A0ACD4NNI6_9HYPH|nr:AAA family ATPase [Antarcticirhabdus aurantiaca]WAJ28406.1 AAA family ATPase [Jeongeuplla avenae]